jgi:hypothetical protein
LATRVYSVVIDGIASKRSCIVPKKRDANAKRKRGSAVRERRVTRSK